MVFYIKKKLRFMLLSLDNSIYIYLSPKPTISMTYYEFCVQNINAKIASHYHTFVSCLFRCCQRIFLLFFFSFFFFFTHSLCVVCCVMCCLSIVKNEILKGSLQSTNRAANSWFIFVDIEFGYNKVIVWKICSLFSFIMIIIVMSD